ncbi:hypothetical protein D9M68_676630 [compost metagenome]
MRVRYFKAKLIAKNHRPSPHQIKVSPHRQLWISGDALRCKSCGVELGVLKALLSNQRDRQLVVREWCEELRAGKPGTQNQVLQLHAPICLRLPGTIAPLDAIHCLAEMVFRSTCKVLEPKLILDGNEQSTFRLEQLPHSRQHVAGWIIATTEHARILQHPN